MASVTASDNETEYQFDVAKIMKTRTDSVATDIRRNAALFHF